MIWRFGVFIAFLACGAVLGTWAAPGWGGSVGAVLAALLWFALDLLRGRRVVRWLRRPDALEPPRMRGLWGEVADRTRRVLRAREQQTEAAEGRLQEFLAAIQASPNGVVLLDAHGRIEWFNQTAINHFGFDAERDLTQLVGNLVRDPDFMAYDGAGDYDRDVVIPGRGKGVMLPMRLSVRLHPYGQGHKLLLSRDITALEQAETMRRDFVANVSHEIRTPLTVLTGFVETLQNLPLEPQERDRYLALMALQAQRMQSLVSDLLTLSRLEGGPSPGVGEWMRVGTLMAQCEAEARPLSEVLGKKHVIRFEPAPELEIACAAGEVLSAMSNLVSNAVRYTPAHRAIDVQWRRLADGRAEFSVRDEGPGIAAEHLPRLTERFYRVDRSRSRETGGTGLGLAIVKHVVQRHGGEMRIESTPGVGSVFGFVLPAQRVRQGLSAAPRDAAAMPATARP